MDTVAEWWEQWRQFHFHREVLVKSKKDKGKKDKGKKKKEPEPEPEPAGDDSDSEEDLMGDQSWAQSDPDAFIGEVDPAPGNDWTLTVEVIVMRPSLTEVALGSASE